MGNLCSFVSLQLCYRCRCQATLIGFARVAFGFCERLVAEDGHDLVRGASGLGETPPCRLAQSVRLAIER